MRGEGRRRVLDVGQVRQAFSQRRRHRDDGNVEPRQRGGFVRWPVPAGGKRVGHDARGNVLDVGLAGRQPLHAFVVRLVTDDIPADLDGPHGDGQTDVSLPDDDCLHWARRLSRAQETHDWPATDPGTLKLTTRQKMTAARAVQRPVLGSRRAFRRGPVVRTRRQGVHWELDLREGIDFAIWLMGRFEPSTVAAYRRLVEPGFTIVDIGANIGAHTLHLRACGATGQVIAFEPTETAFRRLTANVKLNPELQGRIMAVQAMLLANQHTQLPDSVISSWQLLRRRELDPVVPGRPQPTTGARACTLDRALDEARIDGRPDQARRRRFECDVLDGGQETLRRYRPPILCELAPFVFERAGRSIDDLVERFTAHDYRLWDLRGHHEISPTDVDQLTRMAGSMNVLARPCELQRRDRRRTRYARTVSRPTTITASNIIGNCRFTATAGRPQVCSTLPPVTGRPGGPMTQ